ncbi:MAG: delta-lactam-biosynthetic de-N-acetylase [Lachnospiraceae bacterium]|nr:delta-lactam-biosynthetic de-N-acetylase [Lachnospiraceae bacterium]
MKKYVFLIPVLAILSGVCTVQYCLWGEKIAEKKLHGEMVKAVGTSSGSWGLGFGETGTETKPTGSLRAEDMEILDAYYVDDTMDKVIYLTFDCGYESGYTENILDALQKHNAKATFFVVGHYLESAPEIVERMVKDGHTVGNHTYHHKDMAANQDKSVFMEEMRSVEEKYKEITGEEMTRFYRPPQGSYSIDNLQMAKELGYKTFFWSLAYVDWKQDAQPTKEQAYKRLIGQIHPGAIVLLHNTSKTNGEILDELLFEWERMGYRFGELSDICKK